MRLPGGFSWPNIANQQLADGMNWPDISSPSTDGLTWPELKEDPKSLSPSFHLPPLLDSPRVYSQDFVNARGAVGRLQRERVSPFSPSKRTSAGRRMAHGTHAHMRQSASLGSINRLPHADGARNVFVQSRLKIPSVCLDNDSNSSTASYEARHGQRSKVRRLGVLVDDRGQQLPAPTLLPSPPLQSQRAPVRRPRRDPRL